MTGLVIELTLTLPLYYMIAAVVPGLTDFIPPMVVHALMAFGLLVGFPVTLVYARVLEWRSAEPQAEEPPKYGVNDQWERRNL